MTANGVPSALTTMTERAAVHAWRVRFKQHSEAVDTVIQRFTAPEPFFAIAEALSIEDILGVANPDSFVLAFMPSGQTDGYQRISQLQEWVGSDFVPVEMLLQGDRILWTPRKAFILGAVDRKDDLVKSLVTFSFFESRLRQLENEVFTLLARVSQDSHLTHQVRRQDMLKWPEVNRLTRKMWAFRACFVAIEPSLEKAPMTLGSQARRLYSELIVAGEVADRIGALDDQLEVLEDLYESANDRLSEYSYFSREYLLEAIIIVVLGIDLAVTLIDLFFWRP